MTNEKYKTKNSYVYEDSSQDDDIPTFMNKYTAILLCGFLLGILILRYSGIYSSLRRKGVHRREKEKADKSLLKRKKLNQKKRNTSNPKKTNGRHHAEEEIDDRVKSLSDGSIALDGCTVLGNTTLAEDGIDHIDTLHRSVLESSGIPAISGINAEVEDVLDSDDAEVEEVDIQSQGRIKSDIIQRINSEYIYRSRNELHYSKLKPKKAIWIPKVTSNLYKHEANIKGGYDGHAKDKFPKSTPAIRIHPPRVPSRSFVTLNDACSISPCEGADEYGIRARTARVSEKKRFARHRMWSRASSPDGQRVVYQNRLYSPCEKLRGLGLDYYDENGKISYNDRGDRYIAPQHRRNQRSGGREAIYTPTEYRTGPSYVPNNDYRRRSFGGSNNRCKGGDGLIVATHRSDASTYALSGVVSISSPLSVPAHHSQLDLHDETASLVASSCTASWTVASRNRNMEWRKVSMPAMSTPQSNIRSSAIPVLNHLKDCGDPSSPLSSVASSVGGSVEKVERQTKRWADEEEADDYFFSSSLINNEGFASPTSTTATVTTPDRDRQTSSEATPPCKGHENPWLASPISSNSSTQTSSYLRPLQVHIPSNEDVSSIKESGDHIIPVP